ncbi:hypothetical protein HOG98_00370 [bacterium]|jgi:hypothetical protein|nr:hypothetical protein [bacterium]
MTFRVPPGDSSDLFVNGFNKPTKNHDSSLPRYSVILDQTTKNKIILPEVLFCFADPDGFLGTDEKFDRFFEIIVSGTQNIEERKEILYEKIKEQGSVIATYKFNLVGEAEDDFSSEYLDLFLISESGKILLEELETA